MKQLLDSHLYRSGARDSLRHVIGYIARAAKYTHYFIKTGDLGMAGTSNVQGEDQMTLDVVANKMIMDNLEQSHLVCTAASEEEEEAREFKECNCDGGCYSVAFDPLDGSSLIETNLAVGAIFSIYDTGKFVGRTGREQKAAMIVVYGPRTTLIYTVGKGVHEFTLNDVGEFRLTKEDIKMEDEAKNFAPGNLRATADNAKYKALVESWMDAKYTLRYSGGMVPDVNHMFKKGQGIFTYPPNPPKYPKGKLRLLYECNPFSFLMEQAGGAASNGEIPVLDMKIEELHQRTPIFIGSKNEVEKAVNMLK